MHASRFLPQHHFALMRNSIQFVLSWRMSCMYPFWRHHGSERFQIAHAFYVMCIKFPKLVTADSCFQSILWKAFVGCSLTKCHRPPRLN